MGERPRTLPERNLGDLLNETFAIYGRHFWQFIGLVAAVQVPFSFLALVPPENIPAFIAAGIVGFLATVLAYGAAVFAVGQHYVADEITITSCYRRVWWRVVSLLAMGIILGFFVALVAVTAILIIPAVVTVVYLVYWSIAVQAVIIEGFKPVAAMKRSFGLIRGSWWRVFGITLVFGLVSLGLGILLTAPFAIAGRVAAPDEATTLSTALNVLGSMVVAVVVPPVGFIAGTLIYYDLRVRKENYDFAALSREMGLVFTWNAPAAKSDSII